MKKYVTDYYEHTRTYYGTYHNHKEVSAWGGLGLYVLFCGLLVRAGLPQTLKLETTAAIVLFVLLVAFFTYQYISNQLKMKDRGGALAGAAGFLLAEIIQKNESGFDAKEYMKVEDSADTTAQSSHVLPQRLLIKADALNTRARGYQDKTKWMIYSLLILSTISVVSIRGLLAYG